VTPRKIPVAAVQTLAHDRSSFLTAWPRIVGLVDRAARSGSKLIVLPEGTVPGYVLGTEPVPVQQINQAMADLSAVARQYAATIIYGGAKIVSGRTLNAAVAIGPDGSELGYAAKQFLWHFDRRWFTPGDALEPIDTPVGKLGLLVCADGRIPTIAATLVDRGAEILVMSTAWVTSGRDPSQLENIQADFMASVRARENAVPFVAANKAGVELESVAYCGKSVLIDAHGNTVARGDERTEGLVSGELLLGEGAPARAAFHAPWPSLSELRPKARIAFTLADLPPDVEHFSALAQQADADVLIALGGFEGELPIGLFDLAKGRADGVFECNGVRLASVGPAFRSPRALTAARLGGIDLFVWHADADDGWNVTFARTRAAELRAYVIVLDAAGGRSFAVDPDGAVVAGTFEDYRLASFAYDRSRSAATTVAPATDVLEGLRNAEAIRARRPEGVAVV